MTINLDKFNLRVKNITDFYTCCPNEIFNNIVNSPVSVLSYILGFILY